MALSVSFSVAFIKLHVMWKKEYKILPRRPELVNVKTKVLEYDHYSEIHILNRYGIFGMKNKINNADILLIGTSHMEFGISAEELGAILTKKYKKLINVLNLGMGGGESTDFAKKILSDKEINNKVLIVDLHDPLGDNWSYFAKSTNDLGKIQAYIKLFNIWFEYYRDWLLDPIVPKFRPFLEIKNISSWNDIKNKVFAFRRALGWLIVRERSNGDVVLYFGPNTGNCFESTKPNPISPLTRHLDGENQGVRVNAQLEAYLLARSNKIVTTLVPFSGYGLVKIPEEANNFVYLSSENLFTFDKSHLEKASRNLNAQRIAEQIIQKNILGCCSKKRTKNGDK